MPDFTDSQINEAKERVRQMHARNSSYLNNEAQIKKEAPEKNAPEAAHTSQPEPPTQPAGNMTQSNDLDDLFENESMIILMLIMLLSNEGADSILLLALLYLLF